jgi:hypothetical protein
VVALDFLLVVTILGLYYARSDVVRPWINDLHIVVGTIPPALFVIHVLLGRRSTRRGRRVAAYVTVGSPRTLRSALAPFRDT